jgi:hypothetical protein
MKAGPRLSRLKKCSRQSNCKDSLWTNGRFGAKSRPFGKPINYLSCLTLVEGLQAVSKKEDAMFVRFDPRDPPPAKERLLLIVDAAGDPPDLNLLHKCEVTVGYWTGSMFRPMTVDVHDLGTELSPTHWALVEPLLPDGVVLRHQRIFDADVRM